MKTSWKESIWKKIAIVMLAIFLIIDCLPRPLKAQPTAQACTQVGASEIGWGLAAAIAVAIPESLIPGIGVFAAAAGIVAASSALVKANSCEGGGAPKEAKEAISQ